MNLSGIKLHHILYQSFLVLFLYSCAAKKPYIREKTSAVKQTNKLEDIDIDYELYLVGDIGSSKNNLANTEIVDLIKTQLRKSDVKQSVIFLGNSINEDGLPGEESPEFKQLDEEIKYCIQVLKGYTDKVFFIPGNNEWWDGYEHTSDALSEIEDYIESNVNGKNIFVPSHGCGEPTIVELTDDLIIVLIDSQWILEGDRSGERKRSQCEIDFEAELITDVKEKLSKNKNKNVIIAAHHPMYSNGITGGNYSLSSNLLPVPFIGSIITGVKKVSGGQQRFGHPQYQKYRASIDEILKNYEGVIFASAHDKNLQYHLQDDNHFVISGSGADIDFARTGGTADFAYMKQGFAKITHTKDMELWLDFYVVDPADSTKCVSVFNKLLYKKEFINYTDTTVYQPLSKYNKTELTLASSTYAKGIPGMGQTYRKEWGTEIEVPVFLLEENKGGLTPIRQGGGFQTKSLLLRNDKDQRWILRTIDKDVSKKIPSWFRGTFVENIVQDGISANHPYASFVIPKLADAAGIYHTTPKMVWLPKQKALGDYNIDFSDRLYLFEEIAEGNIEKHSNFGNPNKIFSTEEILTRIRKEHDLVIDEKQVLKSRLFDILIGDWDRGDDQWRWGEYIDDETGNNIYRVIPKNRDQAFFKNDGFLNYIASRPYFNPSLRKYDSEIDVLSGLIYSARYFDRSFISELDKEDFISVAEELQRNLTDQVIEDAFKDWPKVIYDLSAEEIINKLKQRRADLPIYAKAFNEFLSKQITVMGTNDRNIFDITTLPDNQLDVKVYLGKKERKDLIWSRVISGDDCEDLVIFGLKKDDTFNISGDDISTIKIKLVGGSGEDKVNNDAADIKIIVYDRKDGMEISGYEVKSELQNRRGINRYDRRDWELDRTIHFPLLNYYRDEGIGISYNIWWKRHGFRKSPYKSNHTLTVSFFTSNSSLLGRYNGHWVSVFGPDWDIKLRAEFTGPIFTQFYYGLGNEYIDYEKLFSDEPDASTTQFYIVKGSRVYLNPHLICNLGNNRRVSLDPAIEFLNIKDQPADFSDNRFIYLDEANLTDFDFENKLYLGLGANYTSNRVNSKIIPTRGYKFYVGANYRFSLSSSEFRNITVESYLKAYIPFTPTQRLVFATNIGGAYTIGNYEFFHANYLATRSRLRGFRRNRFGGDGILYMASDLRYKILKGDDGIRTGVGIFGAFDLGRTFLDGEDFNNWHTSVGGGIFFTPLDLIGFKIGYYIGESNSQLVIGGSLSF